MDITYLGHSSFRIKGKTASIVTDPFDPVMVGLKFPSVEADIVTVSHEHKDHNQTNLVKGSPRVIRGPGEYEIQGISILGFASWHDKKKGEERGENTIYVFEVDGVRICHLGDLGHKLSESMVNNLAEIDVLMIPVGGNYTIGSPIASEIVRNIEPSIVIPMHFKVEGIKISNLEPVDKFLKETGFIVERLPKLSVKKEDIDLGIQKIALLEKK